MELDRKAVRILTETYWSSAGWKRHPETPAEDFAYAKRHGTMFDLIAMSHDQAIKAATDAVSAVSKDAVIVAFLASLSSRRLDLRSALGTYAAGRHMEPHCFENNGLRQACAYCGDYDLLRPIDLNVLNFERMKWGGVRHDQPTYIAFDLQTFETIPNATPVDEDVKILRLILDIAGSMPATARPNHLDKALAKVLPSNSAERRTLIAILGFAGVLVDPSRPNFRTEFVPIERRERTPWHTDDWSYPAMWWMGSHGVNQSAVNEWFAFL
jgi:hypothetical protein